MSSTAFARMLLEHCEASIADLSETPVLEPSWPSQLPG